MAEHEKLPQDQRAVEIQVLGADDTTHEGGTIGASATAVAIPTGSKVMEVSLALDSHVKFGGTGQTAVTTGDRFLPAGSYLYAVLSGQEEVSVIRAASESTTGPISVTRMR